MNFPFDTFENELLILRNSLKSVNAKKRLIEFDSFSFTISHTNKKLLKSISKKIQLANHFINPHTLKIILIESKLNDD